MKLGVEYIKYQWKAKRRHGVHSPFIYDLTDKCFRLPLSNELATKLNKLDSSLKNDSRSIEISDFGAGSKKMNDNRKISSIYKTSSSRGKFGKILFQLVSHYKPKKVLEFGTSLGLGTVCMASGNSLTEVTTIEGCPNTYTIAQDNFQMVGLSNIQSLNLTFNDYIETLSDEIFDLVFIDGHHDGTALRHYLEKLQGHTHNATIFVLDDIRWSDSMFEAWNEIQSDPQYHVTIDLFRMGMIVRREEQEKEHFVIR